MAQIIDRVSSDDLMSLATDRGKVPMQIGVVIVLDTTDGCSPAALAAAIESRLPAVARLRQRLVRPAAGLGRPFWVDDPNFAFSHHLEVHDCPVGQGRAGLLAVAADLLMARLAPDRPLWAARIVTNVAEGRTGVAFVCHHVIADGIGGLDILAALVGVGARSADTGFPRPAPPRTQLLVDTTRRYLASIADAPRAMLRLGHGLTELARALPVRARWSTLNQPIGSDGIRLVTVSADLPRMLDAAHAHRATMNDLALCAITGALADLLAHRGEFADEIVVSVPLSPRGSFPQPRTPRPAKRLPSSCLRSNCGTSLPLPSSSAAPRARIPLSRTPP